MTSAVEQRLDFRAASARFGAEPGDSPRVAELRLKAAQLATELEWPSSRAERPWKYYDATNLAISPATPPADSEIDIHGAGAMAVRFGEAAGAAADTIARHLGSAVEPGSNRLTALHYAFLRDGVLVDVPASTDVSAPIRITRRVTGNGLSALHTLIVTGANSRVTVVEEYHSSGDAVAVLPAAEIIPGPGAEVRYYCIHRWGAATKVFTSQRFLGAERDATFRNLQVVLSGEVVKGHLESSLIGRGTASELLGLAYGAGGAHVDFYTLQDHIGADTRSDLLYKAALTDHARAVYYGLTRVGLGARNADANQENRNLLLSKQARADSDPVLEILTNDVLRASHGATAGPVDQDQLFYLRARGIPEREAEELLVWGFLAAVLARVPDVALRTELEQALQSRLEARA